MALFDPLTRIFKKKAPVVDSDSRLSISQPDVSVYQSESEL